MKNAKKAKAETPIATMIAITTNEIESRLWNLETLRCALEYAITRSIQCDKRKLADLLLREKKSVDEEYLETHGKKRKFADLVDKEFDRAKAEAKRSSTGRRGPVATNRDGGGAE